MEMKWIALVLVTLVVSAVAVALSVLDARIQRAEAERREDL